MGQTCAAPALVGVFVQGQGRAAVGWVGGMQGCSEGLAAPGLQSYGRQRNSAGQICTCTVLWFIEQCGICSAHQMQHCNMRAALLQSIVLQQQLV
jgi:hypothetical protein